jgi:glycosyltransferase involved in cell wall biosynthesis
MTPSDGPVPRISVILPTRDRLGSLRRTLDSLRAQDYPAAQFEILVTDDGSLDGTPEFLARQSGAGVLRTVRTGGRGPAAARNAALDLARGELLAFTDDDCVVPPDWLGRLDALLSAGGADAVGGSAENGMRSLLSEVYQEMAAFFYETHNRQPGQARFLTTNNFACRREALARAGRFDERFRLGGSDREMAHRLVEEGLRVEYRPELVVRHFHHFDARTFLRHLYRQGRGSYLYHRVIGPERRERPAGLAAGGYLAMLRRVAGGHGLVGGGWRVGLAVLGQGAVAAGYLAAALRLQKP